MKLMKKILLTFIVLWLSSTLCFAEWSPPAVRVPSGGTWSPGIPGGIPSRTTIYTTLSETGDATDRRSAINTALSDAGTNEVVYLNAGTYYISGTITIPSNKVLRGAGIDSTYLRMTSSTKTVISMGAGVSWGATYTFDEWEEISSGFGKDSTAVVVSDSGGYVADQLVLITQADGANSDISFGGCSWGKISGSSWPGNDSASIGEMNLISSVVGNTINLTSALHYGYSDTYTASIGRISAAVRNAGVEELTIYRTQAASNSNDDHAGEIFLGRAVYSWVKNVKLDKISGPGINVAWGYGNVIQGADLQESWHYTSGGGGYMMMIKLYSANILIENSILRQANASLQFDVAGAGSVAAYNWMDVAVTNGGTTWFLYNLAPHCSTPHNILFEGNQVSQMENDNTHGNSIYFFALRNEFDARHTEFTSPLNSSMATENRSGVDFNSNAHYWTIVGNVLGRSEDSYGLYQSEAHGSTTAYIYRQPNDVLGTLIRHGNYDYHDDEVKWCVEEDSEADCQGTGTDQGIPDSLYLVAEPSWWDDQGAGRPWPSIGPDIGGYVIDIPAKDRYENEQYAGDPTLTNAVIASNGLTLTLVFDENVTQGTGYQDADWDIDASVTGNDIGITYSSGDGTDTHIYTIASEIQAGETVDIDFNGDADSEEDSESNDLAAIVSDSVTNNSTQGDATPPQLNSATIASNGLTLTLVFDENVTQGTGYQDADWDIDASVTGNDIGITYSSGDGTDTHIYTIASEIQAGETVDIDFNGDADSEEDSESNDLAAIVSDSVTNNSTQGDATPPTLNTAVIASNGTTLTLTFDENVTQGTGYQDADWDIDASVTGNDIGITYNSGDGTDTHIYSIASGIQADETVNIDFNGGADSEEDDANNDLAAIVSDSVTNNSTQGIDETPPATSGWSPGKSTSNIDIGEDIVVHITDDGDGVDGTTIEVDVEGTIYCCSDGSCGNKTLGRSGTSADYTITYSHASWGYEQEINVEIDADDLATPPNSMGADVYSFTTEADPLETPTVGGSTSTSRE